MTSITMSNYNRNVEFMATPMFSATLTLAGLTKGSGSHNLFNNIYAEKDIPNTLGEIAIEMLEVKLQGIKDL